MLAVRSKLHLEVLVLGVEEEGLDHLVLPQAEVGLAGQPPGRGGVSPVGSPHRHQHLCPGAWPQRDLKIKVDFK